MYSEYRLGLTFLFSLFSIIPLTWAQSSGTITIKSTSGCVIIGQVATLGTPYVLTDMISICAADGAKSVNWPLTTGGDGSASSMVFYGQLESKGSTSTPGCVLSLTQMQAMYCLGRDLEWRASNQVWDNTAGGFLADDKSFQPLTCVSNSDYLPSGLTLPSPSSGDLETPITLTAGGGISEIETSTSSDPPPPPVTSTKSDPPPRPSTSSAAPPPPRPPPASSSSARRSNIGVIEVPSSTSSDEPIPTSSQAPSTLILTKTVIKTSAITLIQGSESTSGQGQGSKSMSASTFTSAETSAVDQTSRVISTSTSDADVSISKSRAQSRGSITSISTSVQPSISTQRHSIGTSAHAQPSNSTSHHSSMSFAPSSSTNDPNVSIPPSTSSISSSESRDRNSGPHLSFSTFVWGNFFNHHLSDSQRHAVASSTTSRTESEDCDCEDTTSATSTSASGVWISKPVESSTTSWSRQAPASSSAAPPPSSRQSFSAPPTSSAAPPPPPPPPPPPTPSTSQHTVQTSTSTWSQQSTTSSSAQLSTTTITDTFVFTDGSTTIGQFNPTGSVPGGGGSGGSNDNNGGLDLLGLLMAPPKEYPTKPIESDPSYPTAQPAEDVVHSTSSLSLRPSTSSEGNEIDPQSSLTPEFPKTTSDTIAVQTEQIDPSESIATWIVALLRGARSENPGVAGIDDARLMRRFWPGGRGGGRVFGGEQRPADQASVDSYRPNSEPENSEGQESGYGPGEKPFKQQERKKCPRRRSRETREEDVKRLCVRGM